MKKTVLNFLLLITVTPFLIQCAAQTDVDDLRYQLRIVNKKLEDMKSTEMGQLQKRQAAALGQFNQVEQDILELKSQLEETHHLNQRLKEQNKELEATITNVVQTEATKRQEALKQLEESQREKELRLTEALNEKLRLQQESVKAIQEARIKEAELRAKEASLAAELARTRSKSANSNLRSSDSIKQIQLDQKKIKLDVDTQTVSESQPKTSQPEPVAQAAPQQQAAAPATPTTVEKQPLDDYAKAQKLYESGNYKEAFQLFEQVAANSSGNNMVDARFMMGESLFQQKEYDKAIMQYQNIISQHSDHTKSPKAMLKQGMAFEKLADKDTAKVIYKKLLKKHASSPEAATAQEILSKL
ncbi:MAG: tetratricopeptide repeat protein [Desulforhopalus sp.]